MGQFTAEAQRRGGWLISPMPQLEFILNLSAR